MHISPSLTSSCIFWGCWMFSFNPPHGFLLWAILWAYHLHKLPCSFRSIGWTSCLQAFDMSFQRSLVWTTLLYNRRVIGPLWKKISLGQGYAFKFDCILSMCSWSLGVCVLLWRPLVSQSLGRGSNPLDMLCLGWWSQCTLSTSCLPSWQGLYLLAIPGNVLLR